MESSIIECVPNFSEGQRKDVIEEIAQAIGNTSGCSLLDVDPGASTNRTVYTFVGSPEAVVNGALNAARVASQLIDMRQQTGEHPRLGALDVCPFIPVRGATMQDCVDCAEQFAERLAEDLNVPVFLYGEAARDKDFSTVPQIRAGEYEGLADKFKSISPDFGPREFLPQWGATMTGARKFLIAYNVNMLSTKEQAHRVALNIRTQGRGEQQLGRLSDIQAMGWYLDESNIAQVTVNLGDFEVTGIHTVFEEVKKDAAELNLSVCGSQVVGLVPLQSLMDAAEYYMQRDNLFILDEDQKLRLAIDKLGLSSLGLFNPKQRIIEYMIEEVSDQPLLAMSVKEFIDSVGSRCSAPGGGSVAALVATLGNALATMVSFLTYGNRRYESLDSKIRPLLEKLYNGQKNQSKFIDADTDAFNSFVAASKLPQKTDEEKQNRIESMQRGLKIAIETPKQLAISINELWSTIEELATICNMNCKCDLQVGLRCIQAGVYGAYYNVLTNLDNMQNKEYAEKTKCDIEMELQKSNNNVDKILKILEERS